MILADTHTHTSFSGDSSEPMENMVKAAINKGLKTICFTEHMDLDFPHNDVDPDDMFTLDTDSYYEQFQKLKDQFAVSNPDFTMLFGVELGLQPHLAGTHTEYTSKYPFDYVVGSEHTTNRRDPYFPSFYEGRSEYEAYKEYFEDIVTNLKSFDGINCLAHLDYVVRYGPNKNAEYSYSKYSDIIDEILRILINKGIALETNTGGYKYGLGEPNPCKDVFLRYKELGGELITIGSDAHNVNGIAADFERAEALLQSCGFKHYCIFQNRKPHFIPFTY